jgi:hypothetical protein
LDDVWPLWKSKELSSGENQELDRYIIDRQFGLRTSDNYWKDVRHEVGARRHAGRRGVLFTNLVWDSAVIRQDIAFTSIVDWIVAAVEEFRKRPQDELIIRIHPAETKLSGRESREEMEVALRERLLDIPSNVTIIPSVDPTSSYQLMQDADFGLVYTSTTGLEMVLMGKPVVVAAQTHYRGKGFTLDVNSSAEFSSVLDNLCNEPDTLKPNLELARKYAYLFFFRAPFSNLGVSEPMRGLVSVSSEDAWELLNNGNDDVRRLLDAMAKKSSFNPIPN